MLGLCQGLSLGGGERRIITGVLCGRAGGYIALVIGCSNAGCFFRGELRAVALAPAVLAMSQVILMFRGEHIECLGRSQTGSDVRGDYLRDCDFRRFAGTPLRLLVTGFLVSAASNR